MSTLSKCFTFLFLIFGIGLLMFSLDTYAQQLMHVEEKTRNDISFLQFNSDSCSAGFIKKLNSEYGYVHTLFSIYNEAPNTEAPKYNSAEMLKLIDSIKHDKVEGSLADIGFELTYNEGRLLSFIKYVTPEGMHKSSNSNTSEYPYIFPEIYDLKHEKEIRSLTSFLTTDGIRKLEKLIMRVMYKRALLFSKDSIETGCRIGRNAPHDFLVMKDTISNNPVDNDIYGSSATLCFYFFFTENGLGLGCNDLSHQSVIRAGPSDEITIPWYDLLSYCTNKPNNLISEICKAKIQKPDKTDWIVKHDFANLLETPDGYGIETTEPVKPYLIKGEKVIALVSSGEFLKITYLAATGKNTSGWVAISDLE